MTVPDEDPLAQEFDLIPCVAVLRCAVAIVARLHNPRAIVSNLFTLRGFIFFFPPASVPDNPITQNQSRCSITSLLLSQLRDNLCGEKRLPPRYEARSRGSPDNSF